jgi:hypothetical protein
MKNIIFDIVLSKCVTRREKDRVNYEKKTDVTHLFTWIHCWYVVQACRTLHLCVNHVLHLQHTAGRRPQNDLDKQRITRLQRPFKGYSTDGIMLQAIGYRP